MIWEGKPEFDDALAKTKVRQHNSFGGKVVEILYGAKDANGNPVEPRERDGHGRWFGIETNGVYQMFVWQKPLSEGGEITYGTDFGENALALMEKELLEKRDLCRRAEEIGLYGESDDEEKELLQIEETLNQMTNWNTPKDAEFTKRIGLAKERFESRIQDVRTNREDKEAVLAQARALLEQTNFRNAKNALRRLRNDLNVIASAGNKADDAFWNEFRSIEKTIRKNEEEYFANLDTCRQEAVEKKEALIEEAQRAVKGVTNWNVASQTMTRLFDEWKKAGNAGKEKDDELWEKFNELRKNFFEERKEFFEKRDAEYKESIDQKKALIEQAKALVEKNNLGQAITNQMKELDKKWREAGYSGKKDNDSLWEQFNQVKDVFWNAKREEANKRFQERIEAKEKEKDNLIKQIEDLKYRLTLDMKPVLKEDVERNLYVKEESLKNVEAALENLKSRLV